MDDLKRAIEQLPGVVRRLYDLVAELEQAFGRPFTLDGHFVGSLGEVLASHYYGLALLPCSNECHDATAKDGTLVQVKATQGRSVGLRAEPDHLLVILLKRDGTIEELYNGPGALAWQHVGKRQKNGQCSIGTSKLRRLMNDVLQDQRLPRRY